MHFGRFFQERRDNLFYFDERDMMKKLISVILIFLLCGLMGCGDTEVKVNQNESSVPTKQDELPKITKEVDMETNTSEDESTTTPMPTSTPVPTSTPAPTPIIITEYTQNLIYSIDEDGTSYVVDGSHDKNLTELFIPKMYNGKPVRKIGSGAFEGMPFLTTVVLPDSVVEINPRAFAYCENLTTVVLSKNLSKIWRDAFLKCSKLKRIDLPESLREIDECAFEQTGLESVNLPEGLLSIGYKAFSETRIKEVHIPASLEKISPQAFDPGLGGICRLNKITVSKDNKKYYGEGNCLITKSGTIIMGAQGSEIPDGVTSVAGNAFRGCILEKVYMPDSVVEIGDYAFADAMISEIRLSENLTSIGSSAFWSVDGLSSIVIPPKVEEIGSGCFESCWDLREVQFEGTTEVSFYVFAYCNGLEKAVFTKEENIIDEDAFKGCSNVKFYVESESSAEKYAKEKGIPYELRK